jgi:hypothetical protein
VVLDQKHQHPPAAIFATPTRSNVLWEDLLALFVSLGAEISEGRGSGVRIALYGRKAVFHRPHPQTETGSGALKSVQRFLIEAGVQPHDGL